MSMHSPLFPVEFDDLPSYRSVNNVKQGDLILLKNNSKDPLLDNIFRPENKSDDDDVKVYVHQSYAHPSDGVMVYKVEFKGKKLVFATDVEGYKTPDSRLVNFSKDADLLIHDAQYTNDEYPACQGFGHSTMDMAVEVAKAANAKKLALFHHDPRHNDEKMDEIFEYTKTLFPDTIMAMENLEIDLFSSNDKSSENSVTSKSGAA